MTQAACTERHTGFDKTRKEEVPSQSAPARHTPVAPSPVPFCARFAPHLHVQSELLGESRVKKSSASFFPFKRTADIAIQCTVWQTEAGRHDHTPEITNWRSCGKPQCGRRFFLSAGQLYATAQATRRRA
eukprot:IDg2985t1